jgi:4-amino-4-deoxy-L-arabinose transferase-like glycosyltransferase
VSSPSSRERLSRSETLLAGAIAIVLLAVWLEPRGSWLAEPDEPRYAEIPREMLASHDFVTPRLDGVPYFEKPPLLYWSNAAAMRTFGQNPWAARLPTRLAGLGTTLLVAFAVARARGRAAGLAAAGLFLTAPLVLTFSRLNLTDGVLTFFFAATLLAARAAIERRASGRTAAAWSAVAGALAAAGFLSKGLVAIVLPGGILLCWCLAAGRLRALSALLLGPAVPAFLLLGAPWFVLAERRNPGFLHFFFIHEHFQRFTTPEASRPGPIYYFVMVFVLGFLPGLPFFLAGLRRIRRDTDALFYAIWFFVVLVFFSISHSKLSPYLFPAFPAAAALAARGFVERENRPARWLATAVLSTALLAAAAAIPGVRSAVAIGGVEAVAIAAALFLLVGSWGAWALRGRAVWALACLAAGWGLFYVGLALIYPRTPTARDLHELAQTASESAAASSASIVFYRTYVQTFPWELKRLLPVADHTGELEPWFLPEQRRREIFWSRGDFWRAWAAGPIVAVARTRDRGDFPPSARVVESRGKYCLVTNR